MKKIWLLFKILLLNWIGVGHILRLLTPSNHSVAAELQNELLPQENSYGIRNLNDSNINMENIGQRTENFDKVRFSQIYQNYSDHLSQRSRNSLSPSSIPEATEEEILGFIQSEVYNSEVPLLTEKP